MSSRRKRDGKEISGGRSGDGGGDDDCVDLKLPKRLFATDRFPDRRLNCYSTVDLLLFVRDVLEGSEEWDILMRSPFGRLMELPARRCAMSGKLGHAMIVRQLITKKKFELWPVFGGNPFRFSLAEFGAVTGLPCGEFDDGYTHVYEPKPTDKNYEYWEKLIGDDRAITLEHLVNVVAGDYKMKGWRRLRLCLIIIVDGVLVRTAQFPRPSLKYVMLVEDLRKFFAFPWGRESYLWTISTMKPGPKILDKVEDPIGEFVKRLMQETTKMVGFPLSLQLVAYECIPCLLARLSGDDSVKLKDYKKSVLPKHAGLNIIDIRNAEHDPELKVQPMLELSAMGGEEWIPFDDERMDHEVAYMVGEIGKGRVFRKTDWGGGDMRVDLYVHGGAQKKKRRVDVVECDVEGTSMNQGGADHSGGDTERPVDIVVARLTLEVETLKKEIVLLKKTVRSLVRRVGRRRGRKRDSVRKQGVASQQGGGSPQGGGSQLGDDGGEDCGGSQQGVGSPNNQGGVDVSDEMHLRGEEVVGQNSGAGDSFSSDEAPRLLVRLKQGDGIPLQWADGGRPGPDGNVLYDGTTSNTYFVADSQVGLGGGGPLGVLANVNPLSYVDGQDSSFVADDMGGRSPGNGLTVEDAERLDVVVQGFIGTSEATASKSGPEMLVAGGNTYVDLGVLQEQSSANVVVGTEDAVKSHDNQRVDSDPMTRKETLAAGDDTNEAVAVVVSVAGPVGEQMVGSDPMVRNETSDGGDETMEALAVERVDSDPMTPKETRAAGDDTNEAVAVVVSVAGPVVEPMVGSDPMLRNETSDGGDETMEALAVERVSCDSMTPKNPKVGGDEEIVSAAVDESVGGAGGDQVTVSRPDSCLQTCEASKKDTVQVGLEVGPSMLIEPRRPGEQEAHLAALFLTKDPYEVPEIVPSVEDCDYPAFIKVLESAQEVVHAKAGGKEDLNNKFFIELATSQDMLSDKHMEVLMKFVEKRHGGAVLMNQGMFVPPWFACHLQGRARSFKAANDKTVVVADARVTKYLTMKNMTWGVEVDRLYTPMKWGGSHWVGLCISLSEWRVLVFDPKPSLNSDEEVGELLADMSRMLPYIARKVSPTVDTGEHEFAPFLIERVVGVYEIGRGGDCVPLAAKLLEMHANGMDVTNSGLNDEVVDIIRKQFAMDLYKVWVVPLYV